MILNSNFKLDPTGNRPSTSNQISNYKRGFTIIELIISIFILAVGLVGIFNALSVITILTSDSTDRLTATYLAQEGMEVVRNIRDSNWLNMDTTYSKSFGLAYSWVDGLTSGGNITSPNCATQICEADYTSSSLGYGNDYLSINSKYFYDYNENNDSTALTKFKRKITVTPVVDVDGNSLTPHILKVVVSVSWDKKATILSSGVKADFCCPNSNTSICPAADSNVSNCITTEETLYNWYNTTISVVGVTIVDSNPTGNWDPVNKLNTLYVNGASDQLTATITPSSATNKAIIWSSGDISKLTVDGNGVVRAVAPGTTTVTATAADNSSMKDIETFTIAPPQN